MLEKNSVYIYDSTWCNRSDRVRFHVKIFLCGKKSERIYDFARCNPPDIVLYMLDVILLTTAVLIMRLICPSNDC